MAFGKHILIKQEVNILQGLQQLVMTLGDHIGRAADLFHDFCEKVIRSRVQFNALFEFSALYDHVR